MSKRVGAAVLLLLAASVGAATAGDDARKLDELWRSSDPADRIAFTRRAARSDAGSDASRLGRLARSDPAEGVRAAAARALGASPHSSAPQILKRLLRRGGTMRVRDAVADALLRHDGGLDLIRSMVFDPHRPAADRLLGIEALSRARDLDSARQLQRLCGDSNPWLRTHALRALARHHTGRELLPELLLQSLRKADEPDPVLCSLRLALLLEDRDELRAIADAARGFERTFAREAVLAVRERLQYLDDVEEFESKRDTPYAWSEPPVPPPPEPIRDDVWVFDATGSLAGHLPKVRGKIVHTTTLLRRYGVDSRVGIVAYRDVAGAARGWTTRTLPLTHDLDAVIGFLSEIDARGADSQGAAIVDGLEEAYDRMNWRRGARRSVSLIADSRAGEPARCKQLAAFHLGADRTRLHVWFLRRTRSKVPEDLRELAEAGGGVFTVLD